MTLTTAYLWIRAHELELLGAAVALVAAWKAIPAALRRSLEERYPRLVGGARVLVALLPDVLGAARSGYHGAIKGEPRRELLEVETAVEALSQERADEISRTQGIPGKPRGEAGYSALSLLALTAAVTLAWVWLSGCPMPAPDGCTPRDTRCSPAGIPEVCSATQRWSHAPPSSSCADRGPVVCCLARSPWGREVHACVPASECIAADGGAL